MKNDVLTGRIIGCAMKVHSVLGSGYREVIYQRALASEMKKQDLNFVREMVIKVFYDNICVGNRRVDFFIENEIMLELKAVFILDNSHLAQSINYLEAYGLPFGLLINFGSKSLVYKRVYNSKHPENEIC